MSGDLEIALGNTMADLKRTMINEALRLVRLYWGLSQIELAERVSLSQSMISDIERGAKEVSVEVLEKYSKELGIRMSQLLFFAEELDGQPPQKRGRLVVANRVLELLRALAPSEMQDAKGS